MKPTLASNPSIRSAATVQTLGLSLACFVFFLLTVYASDPASWNDPAWWSNQGAVLNPQITTNNGVVTTNYIANNNAIANQGQLKQFTVGAVRELNFDYASAGGAGPALSNLVYGWQEDYATNGYATNVANPTRPYKASDFQAVNVGQLKYIGNQIWARLVAVGYTNAVPGWLQQNTNTDYTAATLSQLKTIFDFNIIETGLAVTPTFSPGSGTYASAQIVTLTSATPGAIIYYTTDGTTPTTGSPSVTSGGTIQVTGDETVNAMAPGLGFPSSPVGGATYTIQAASPPTLTVVSGTYSTSQTVTLSSATPGATIYYTTDGTTPTTSSSSVASGGSVTVNASETLQAIAVAPGYTTAPAVSATYAIDPTATFLQAGITPQLWLRADIGVISNSGSVSQWNDQSGNGNNVVQATVANQPTLVAGVVNGQPVLRFNGTSQNLALGTTTPGVLKVASITMMAVYDLRANGSYPSIFAQNYAANGWSGPGASWGLYAGNSTSGQPFSVVGQSTTGNGCAFTATSTSLSTPYLLEGTYDQNQLKVYLNGGSVRATTSTSGPIVYGTGGLMVGTDVKNDWLNGDIAEILVFNGALSDAQRQQVEAYLYQKYGVGTQPVAQAPILTPGAGTFSSSQFVTIRPGTNGDTVYYTTDGTDPTVSSTRQTVTSSGALTIGSTTQIREVETGPGYSNNALTATYTIDPTATFLQAGLTPELWLRADTGVISSGGSVSQWTDQSGNGNNMVQATVANQPTLVTGVVNGQPVLRFNGTSQSLALGMATPTGLKVAAITMMAVYDLRANGSYPPLILQNYAATGWTGPAASWSLYAGNNTSGQPYAEIGQGLNSNGSAYTATSTSLNTPYLLEGTYDENRLRAYLNGGSVKATTALSGPIIYGTGSVTVGMDNINDRLNGDIAEILIFNGALSDPQRQQVEAYLYQKYGIGTQPMAQAQF